jgi:nucleotide-binding universal stress UspA family protein
MWWQLFAGVFRARQYVVNINKIVVGTDFSELAEQAITQALHVACHVGAELVLVHAGAVAERAGEPFGIYDEEVRAWEHSNFQECRRHLDALREKFSGQGVVVSQALRKGHPPDALCEAAEELGAKLVVVGSRGRNAVSRFFLGSVADKALQKCHDTLLVARSAGKAGGFSRILVPVNFDEFSDLAIETALALAAKDAEIELFHCWSLPYRLVEDWDNNQASLAGSIRSAMVQQTDERLNRLLLEHRRPGVKIVSEQVEASARDGILQRLESSTYDLVVVGSRELRGIKRLFTGSVAEATARHAPCSVAVVKEGVSP